MFLLNLLSACFSEPTNGVPAIDIAPTQSVDLGIANDKIFGLMTAPDAEGCIVVTNSGNILTREDGSTETVSAGLVPTESSSTFTTTGDSFIYNDDKINLEFTVPGCMEKSILGVAPVSLDADGFVEAIFNAQLVSGSPVHPAQGIFTIFGWPEDNVWGCDKVEIAQSEILFPIASWSENHFCTLGSNSEDSSQASLNFYAAAE